MGWREAWRLGRVAFNELALQATYSFRLGNPVPPAEGRTMVARARRRVAQSKALIAGLLGLLVLGASGLLHLSAADRSTFLPFALPDGLYEAGVLTGLAGLEVALLWWTGLQALPAFLTSAVVPVLEPLPIDRATLRRVAGLLYVRLFDLPAGVVLILTPIGVGLALGPWAALASVPLALSAVGFALALALLTGRFFVRRILGARGGGGRAIVRWAYLVLWLLPAFGLLAFVTASPTFFTALADLVGGPHGVPEAVLVGTYPLALAAWTPLAAGGTASLGLDPGATALVLGAGAAYLALAVWATVWMFRAAVSLSLVPPAEPGAVPPQSFAVRPQRAPFAVLTKDLRLASRTPGYAFLILLPLLDALALGLVTFAGSPSPSAARNLAFGAVSAAALLAIFFGPAFFALEVIAQAYARTLPLPSRAIALGKVTLLAAIYLVASGIVLGLTDLKVGAPLLFAAFVGAELPAVVAAGLLELALLFRWSRTRGLAVTNLYAGAWRILFASLPGVVVAAAPLAVFAGLGLGGMAALALGELAVVAPIALGRGAT